MSAPTKARNYREHSTEDKESWGPGAWQDEPDKIQWIDEATDLDCLMVRGPGGHWCGYVGVGPEHPWHGVGYSSCTIDEDCGETDRHWCGHSPELLVDVHGGLTFASACQEADDESHGICHVPAEGRPDHVWWFGFDCAHAGDTSPKYTALYGRNPTLREYETYKGRAYVEGEIRNLARQIAAKAEGGASGNN